MRLIGTPSVAAYRRLAASRSRCASRFNKSLTQTHGIDRLVEYDLDERGLARTPIEQGAKRHLIHPGATPAKYCHTGNRLQPDTKQIKLLPQLWGILKHKTQQIVVFKH